MKNKKILLAVTGSIAAYKAVFLLRLLRKAGCEVKVIMTPSAKDFVSPLTFSVLSEHKVDSDISDGEAWNNHVETGLWADLMIIAPCTANTMAKMAYGMADNVVLATYLSARCPVVISPAMDVDMYHHPSTQANLDRLSSYGVHVIPVEYGELASGLIGEGRMAEPETIFNYSADILKKKAGSEELAGKKILITAGPTHEAIDPVRYIGNRSSGKMGVALAKACASRGAEVDIVLGPTHLDVRDEGIEVYRVQTASQMFEKATILFEKADVAIMAAAVADFRPSQVSEEKLKKKGDENQLTLQLEKTEDIAAALGEKKNSGQLLVGFALETNNEVEHAIQKMKKKNFDFIVLNSLRDKGAGFGFNTNKITIIDRDGKSEKFELKRKSEVADDIVNKIVNCFKEL